MALTADVGESFGNYTLGDDATLLDILTNANVACGFHAGDPLVMERTVGWCVEKGVEIGAHPGFRDLVGFGRRDIDITLDELRTDLLYQIGALDAFVRARGARLAHLIPHGRLGMRCAAEESFARVVVDVAESLDPSMVIMTQEGPLARIGRERGLPVVVIFLADRAYEADGTLRSRRLPGAVIDDADQIAERTIRMAHEGNVVAWDGTVIEARGDVVLLHGDNVAALDSARQLRTALSDAGVELVPASRIAEQRSRP